MSTRERGSDLSLKRKMIKTIIAATSIYHCEFENEASFRQKNPKKIMAKSTKINHQERKLIQLQNALWTLHTKPLLANQKREIVIAPLYWELKKN